MVAERTSARMNARMHQHVMSSTAAHEIAMAPSSERSIRSSVRIRASTGNAVMLMDTPMNIANDRNGTAGDDSREETASANSEPSPNGTMMLRWLMVTAARARPRNSPRSNSSP